MTDDATSEGWYLVHWTHDARREIGSVPAIEKTTVDAWGYDPIAEKDAEIERLKANQIPSGMVVDRFGAVVDGRAVGY